MFFLGGLILLLAGGSWFTNASTVGLILITVGVVELGVYAAALRAFFRS